MTEYLYRAPEPGDAEALAANLADEDRAEVWAASRYTPEQAILTSLDASPEPLVMLADREIVAMAGIGVWSPLALFGTPWMLGARSLPAHGRSFLRASAEYFKRQREKYIVLQNYVDARHERAVRWIGWLGFEISDPAPLGPDGLPFHRFRWEKK